MSSALVRDNFTNLQVLHCFPNTWSFSQPSHCLNFCICFLIGWYSPMFFFNAFGMLIIHIPCWHIYLFFWCEKDIYLSSGPKIDIYFSKKLHFFHIPYIKTIWKVSVEKFFKHCMHFTWQPVIQSRVPGKNHFQLLANIWCNVTYQSIGW